MKTIELFPNEFIEKCPELKQAIEDCWKKGYDVNHWIMLEPDDYKILME